MADDEERQIDAETVEVVPARQGGPVDPPDQQRTLYANVVQRRDEQLQPIVPAVWRNPDQRREVLRWIAWYGWYQTRFHAVRVPFKYLPRIAWYTPRGAGRLLGRQVRWAAHPELSSMLQAAASAKDYQHGPRIQKQLANVRTFRGGVLTAELVAAAVGGVAGYELAPWWVLAAAAVGGTGVLARAGRPAGKTITDRVSTGPRFTKLTGEMVRQAVVALRLPAVKELGDIDFPPPGIHRDGPGWLARFNLPQGVEATEVLEKRGKLSSALRLPVDQVWPTAGPEHAGQVDLWVGYLPSSRMGQPKWSLASAAARTSVFEPAEFGTDQRQRRIKTRLFENNFLIGGRPGSGKSFAARTLATIAALDPTCEMKMVEYKGTGDFLDFAPLCSTYACGLGDEELKTGADIITWGLAEAERRGARIRRAYERGEAPERKVTPQLASRPGSGLHPVFILIDEAHELFGDPVYGKDAGAAAVRLAKRGRALNIILVIVTQIPDKESLPTGLTRVMGMRWCLAVSDYWANDAILGTGAYKRGITATSYRPGPPPDGDAGWGMFMGLAEPMPVRAQFPDPGTTKAILARATALRGGAAVGTDLDVAARRDILDDVIRVFAHVGRPGLHWQTLAALLGEEDPDVYGRISPEALSALVRDEGVDSRDVRVDGRTLKGCYRRDVESAIAAREITDGR
jgi:DNA segregation ATPase FtsK/SpoIIIE, S-DNA-T family